MLVYNPFSLTFLLLVVLYAAVMVFLIAFLKKKSRSFVKKFVIIFFLAGVIYFLIYKFMLVADEEYAAFRGMPGSIFEELPFNPCNIVLWLMPIAILTGKKGLYSFCFFTSLIAAPTALLSPVDGFAGYSIFVPRVMGFILTHLAVFSAWIFLYFLDIYVPRKRDVPLLFLTTVVIAFAAFLFNLLLRSMEGCGQPNYFFTAGPDNDLMRVFYSWIPIPYVYILPVAAAEALLALGITAVFQLLGRKRAGIPSAEYPGHGERVTPGFVKKQ